MYIDFWCFHIHAIMHAEDSFTDRASAVYTLEVQDRQDQTKNGLEDD